MVTEVCALIAQRHGIAARPGRAAPGRSGRLPAAGRGRHHRLLPGGEPRAKPMLPRLKPAVLRGSDHRGRHRPARPDPGRHGAPLPAPAAGAGAGDLPASQPGAGAEGDAGRDHLPGAGDPGRGGAGRLHAGRGRPAAPGDEPQPVGRGHGGVARALHGRRAANGVEQAVAEEVFRQLQGFATYGFCKSHAASFALIAYQTLWLKAHYPAEFYCALLNHQPMGFYSPEVVVGDAKRHGITVLRPDVNAARTAARWRMGMGDGDRARPLPPPSPSPASPRPALPHGLGEAGRARLLAARGSWALRRSGRLLPPDTAAAAAGGRPDPGGRAGRVRRSRSGNCSGRWAGCSMTRRRWSKRRTRPPICPS